MSKRQNQRQASVGANRTIADATAQIARLRTQIRELAGHGSDCGPERDALDEFEARINLLRSRRRVVRLLLHMTQRQGGERRPAISHRQRPTDRSVWPPES